MELRCMQSPAVSSIPPTGLIERPFSHGHSVFKLPVKKKRTCPHARNLKFLDLRAPVSGTIRATAAAQDVGSSNVGSTKEKNVVFVAGATGKVGSRTVRELLKLGFNVRAGVRSIQRAQSLVQSVKNMKIEDVAGGAQPIDKLELVECDLEKPDQIRPALNNSSIVICTIGASEKEVFDITGPYRIDFQATKNLIDAATTAKVDHFILVTSLGTNKFGFPAAILNLFWGVLCWKRKAEEALFASGLPYTIVRPGGMERPTDSYKETHNITLSEEDTLFGGQVSNLQVAELLAFMAKNRSLSYCKVVEVIAETTAPLTPLGDLLKKIPSKRKEVIPSQESDAVVPEPIIPKSIVVKEPEQPEPVIPESIVEKEPEQIKPTLPRPSSPYYAYEDLKPPTSPTPTPSTGSVAKEASKMETAPAEAIPTPAPLSVEVNSSEPSSIVVDSVTPQITPKKQRASSPYINYEDLKPPTSPTPTPSTGSSVPKAINAEIPPAETSSTSTSIEIDSSEKPTITIDNATPLTDPKKTNASSPYINYEDLKPPSSPTPTPSGIVKKPSIEASPLITGGNDVANSVATTSDAAKDPSETLASDQSLNPVDEETPPAETISTSTSIEVDLLEKPTISIENATPLAVQKKTNPSSPYINYEDLKPPSSPTPSPSGFVKKPSIEVENSVTTTSDDAKDPSEALASDQSPNPAFEDLKPPPLPPPIEPIVEGNGKPETPVDEKTEKARPLSPYTMYEDLKPPSSPVPSPRK